MAIEKFVLRGSKPVIKKDPNDILDYAIDYADWLQPDADTIASASVPATSGGIAVESITYTTTRVTAWLSGGVAVLPGDPLPSATYRIVTAGGRTVDRTLYFKVTDR